MRSFYQSDEWRNLVERLRIERVNENGELICEHCGLPITKKYDIIGHHVIPLTAENEKDAMISLNPDNIQLIHFACHNKIHKRAEGHKYEGYTQKVYIVYGSPCAGKTSFVNKNANDDDLNNRVYTIGTVVIKPLIHDCRNSRKVELCNVRAFTLGIVKSC